MQIQEKVLRLPSWMKVPLPNGENYSKIKNTIQEQKLHTICSSGNCPNKGECWSAGTATFMILGDICTRNCRFCYVKNALPEAVDMMEPLRLAKAIKALELKHCVITSVARDDLKDGGIHFWSLCIRKVFELNPQVTMETLIPDFNRDYSLYQEIFDAAPQVISHNVETVERLSPKIRSLADYNRSLKLLKFISDNGFIAKSGIMLGLGETREEVLKTLQDIKNTGVRVVTIGQYLPPSEKHTTLLEYVKPEIFDFYREKGLEMGFDYVESSPLVRSSYHAERHAQIVISKKVL